MNDTIPAPTEMYATTLEWVRASGVPDSYMEFYIAEPEQAYTPPKGLDPDNPALLQLYPGSPKAHLALIPSGRVWGNNGVTIAPDNRVMCDLSLDWHRDIFAIFKQMQVLPPVTYTEEHLASLTFFVSQNYYHWMMDVLPRIDLLRHSGQVIHRYIISRGGDGKAFQQETLSMLGITPDKIIECRTDLHLQAARLLVPSLVCSSAYPKWACDFLQRELLLTRYGRMTGKERIYVSREDTTHRRVANEEEILHVLGARGFRKVTIGSMSVDEQIRLFASADVVVGPHGAGFTNLVFCSPGTRVVELFSPYYINSCYWLMSNHVGLDYYFLVGKDFKEREGDSDVWIDPGRLAKVLDKVGV